MQKTSFSRWWSITQPAPMTPQLYTKVVFTQQIKRRLRLKTFFISTVIIIIIMFGFKSKYGHKRAFTCHQKLDNIQHSAQIVWNPPARLHQTLWHLSLFVVLNGGVIVLWWWWGSLGLSGEVGRSWRYCNARPTRDEAGASSWTSSPCKNQFNIEGGTWPPYQILSW